MRLEQKVKMCKDAECSEGKYSNYMAVIGVIEHGLAL